MTLNRLTLIGFVGANAEEKTNSKASTYTAFSVATKTSWTKQTARGNPGPNGTAAWPTARSPVLRQP